MLCITIMGAVKLLMEKMEVNDLVPGLGSRF